MTFRQMQLDAKNEGKAEGREEGKIEQAKATAWNLHEAGMADSMIAKMVGYAETIVTGWNASRAARAKIK